jgi:hypothetical protein
VAEHEGRRGLFPDNFVKFLFAELNPPLPVSPSSQPPPSLPAKPHKFGRNSGIVDSTQQQPPVANSRDSKLPSSFINSLGVLIRLLKNCI